MSLESLYGKPGHLIRRMQQIAVGIFAEECAEFDLTSVQYAALVAIETRPQVDATRLSALVAFDRSTVGSVLERLEAKGLIERLPSGQDRRVKLLSVTAAGHAALAAIGPAVERAQERMLSPLPPAERAPFMRALQRLVDEQNDLARAPLRWTEADGAIPGREKRHAAG